MLMDSSRLTYVFAAFLALGLVVLAWRMWAYEPEAEHRLESAAVPVDQVDPSSLSLYSSGEYGISFVYPAAASLATTSGSQGRDGAEVASLALADSAVRIYARVAPHADDCYDPAPSEERDGEVEFGARMWRTFTRESLGTEQERVITQYRTLDGSRCVTVEASEKVGGVDSPLITTVLSGITIAPLRSEAR